MAVSSRKANACEAVAGAINAKHPGAAIAVPANISSKDDLQRLVDETRRAFGKIDILVCNAASNPYYGPMSGLPDEGKVSEDPRQQHRFATNWLIHMVAPEMAARKDGAIIVISSIGGLRGSGVLGAYEPSPRRPTCSWPAISPRSCSPSNIRVNCTRPWPGEDRFRPRSVGHQRGREPRQLRDAPAPVGRTGRHRRGRRVPGLLRAGAWMTGHQDHRHRRHTTA